MSVDGRAGEANAALDSHSRITRVLGKDKEDGELAGGSCAAAGPGGAAGVSAGLL